MTISQIIIFLGILFSLVVVHEFGHFLFAKLFRMRVDEFAFGFPPRLLTKKYGETTYSFNLIPLGGYVRIFGENGLTEEEKNKLSETDRVRLFGNKSIIQRLIVLSGGVLFNIIGAVILFSFALMYGSNMPVDESEIASIPFANRDLLLAGLNDKSPLKISEISLGDKILAIRSGEFILSGDALYAGAISKFIQEYNNSKIEITFSDRLNQIKTVDVVPQAGIVEGKKIIGASFQDFTFKKLSFFESLPAAFNMTVEQLKYIFLGLYQLLNDLIFNDAKVEENVSGPIGLAMMTAKISEKGLDKILMFAAMLSLSLAAFNILPIPALDGGRILFVLIEFISGRKIKVEYEQIFHGLGFLALLCLMLFVSYFDIVKALAG